MKKEQNLLAQMQELYRKIQPGMEKTADVFRLIGLWGWRLRKFLLAIPIVWLAIYFAQMNYNMLPEMVGIDFQLTGGYARMVSREMAVYGPLAVTAVCLLMMMLSRKTLYPWLICLFSMALPLLILVTNIFPG